MVDTGKFATKAEILRKAGGGASATSSAEEYTNQFIAEAESYINVLTKTNYSDSFSGLNSDVKSILKEAASNLAAIYVIQYDVSGYNSTREAENIINTNWQRFTQCIKLLINQNYTNFINNA